MKGISERIWLISHSKPSSQPCEDQRFPGISASIHIQMTFISESLVQKSHQPQTFSDLLLGHPAHITLAPLYCWWHFSLDAGYLSTGLASALKFLILRTSSFYFLYHLQYESRQLFLQRDNKGMSEETGEMVALFLAWSCYKTESYYCYERQNLQIRSKEGSSYRGAATQRESPN